MVESRVVADFGMHPICGGGVTCCQAVVLDHGRCCRMRQQGQAVLLVESVAGQTGLGDALNGNYWSDGRVGCERELCWRCNRSRIELKTCSIRISLDSIIDECIIM